MEMGQAGSPAESDAPLGEHVPKAMDMAHHEFGHAVAGYLLGRRFNSVSVQGHIHFEEVPLHMADGRADREAITGEAIVTLAGPLAQRRYVQSRGSQLPWMLLGECGEGGDADVVRQQASRQTGRQDGAHR